MHRVCKVWGAAALVAAATLWASAAQAAWITKTLGRETVYIFGDIKAGDAEEFAAMVDDKVKRVFVTSRDGAEREAAQIGRLIKRKQLDVVATDCFHACAHYIFPAGATSSVKKGGLVALKAGVIPFLRLSVADLQSMAALSEAEGEQTRVFIAQYAQALSIQGSDKESFEREMGLNAGIIAQFEAITTPRRLDVHHVTEKRFQAQVIKGACDYWVPDRNSWRALGANVVDDFVRPDLASIAKSLKTEPGRVALVPVPLTDASTPWCANQQSETASMPKPNAD